MSETDHEGRTYDVSYDSLPDDAPEADVLEQRQGSTVVDDRTEDDAVPIEADPADVNEQRREVGADDEDDYR